MRTLFIKRPEPKTIDLDKLLALSAEENHIVRAYICGKLCWPSPGYHDTRAIGNLLRASREGIPNNGLVI